MTSVSLDLQDVLGDAIVAQLATDAITADVTTNPAQGAAFPYVVIGEDSESSEDTNKSKLKSSVAHTFTCHSDSMTEAKQVAKSVIAAVGPGGAALTVTDGYIVARELEANDLIPERRPEGDLYHVLVRVRYLISHI